MAESEEIVIQGKTDASRGIAALRVLAAGGSPLRFGPPVGTRFFGPYGWRLVSVHGLLRPAARARRVPFGARIAALFADRRGQLGKGMWGGVCLLEAEGRRT